MGLFRRKPKPTHYRVHVNARGSLYFPGKYEDKMYLMDYDTAKEFFYNLPNVAGYEFNTYNNILQWDREHVFDKWFEMKIKEGCVKMIDNSEYTEFKVYNYCNYPFGGNDQLSFCLTHPKKMTSDQIIIGIVGGLFFGGIVTGLLFESLLFVFGVCSLLVGGVILGRDLEKDYSD